MIRTAIPVIIIDYPTNQAENFSWMQSVSKNLFLVFGGKASERESVSSTYFPWSISHQMASFWCKLFVSVDRLGKLPSKEQQLSRTQHFILKAHAAIFGLHIQYGLRRTPLTSMIQRQNCLLSTCPDWVELSKYSLCTAAPVLLKKSERSVCDLPLIIVFRNNFA